MMLGLDEQTLETRSLARNEALFRQRDKVAAIYFVEAGRLRLEWRTFDGRLLILGITPAVGSCRSRTFCRHFPLRRRGDRAITRAPTARHRKRVGLSREASYRTLASLERDGAIERARSRILLKRSVAVWRMELRNIHSARDRVLQYLWLRVGTYGRSIPIEGQLRDIASEIGMTREALYRTLAALETEGCLTRTETAILLEKSDSP